MRQLCLLIFTIILSSGSCFPKQPDNAALTILERGCKHPIPFHWFRNILKTPTWYVAVMEEVRRLNPNIELLDAPTFFELYKIYLEQNPDAANGKIDF